MQQSDTVIARLKLESQQTMERQNQANELYQKNLEKLNDTEQLLRRRQATSTELKLLLQKKDSQIQGLEIIVKNMQLAEKTNTEKLELIQ